MNRDRVIGFFCCVSMIVVSPLAEAEQPWIEVKNASQATADPAGHRVIELDTDRLEALLDLARPEGVGKIETRPIIELPLPDGSFGRFRIEDSPVMAPGLAMKFPEIRCYRGTGVDDPAAVARIGLTLKGFHGMILSTGKTVFTSTELHLGTVRSRSGVTTHERRRSAGDLGAADRDPLGKGDGRVLEQHLLRRFAPVPGQLVAHPSVRRSQNPVITGRQPS